MTSGLFGLLLFLVHVLGFLSAILALLSSRTSQGAVAWIISLMTLPYVAVPAFWIFGRPRFYGYVSARGERDTVLRRIRALPGRTTIAVTHRPAAVSLCSWRLEISNGKICAFRVDTTEGVSIDG